VFLVIPFKELEITLRLFESGLYGKISTRESQVVGDICTMIAYGVFDVRC